MVQARPAARLYHDQDVPQDTEVRSGVDDIFCGSNYLIQPEHGIKRQVSILRLRQVRYPKSSSQNFRRIPARGSSDFLHRRCFFDRPSSLWKFVASIIPIVHKREGRRRRVRDTVERATAQVVARRGELQASLIRYQYTLRRIQGDPPDNEV